LSESNVEASGSKLMKMEMVWGRLNARRDHRWAEPRFSAYVEGDLPARQQRRLARHEGICPECRRAIRQLKKLLKTLPGLRSDKAPADLAERTARSVRERIEREHPPSHGG
jgi:anti-sigma factor RsiW